MATLALDVMGIPIKVGDPVMFQKEAEGTWVSHYDWYSATVLEIDDHLNNYFQGNHSLSLRADKYPRSTKASIRDQYSKDPNNESLKYSMKCLDDIDNDVKSVFSSEVISFTQIREATADKFAEYYV